MIARNCPYEQNSRVLQTAARQGGFGTFLLMGSKRADRKIGFQIASYYMTPMTVDFKNRNSADIARDPVGQKRERALPAFCVCRERCAMDATGADRQCGRTKGWRQNMPARAEFRTCGCAVEE